MPRPFLLISLSLVLVNLLLFFITSVPAHAGDISLCKNIPGKERVRKEGVGSGIFSKGYDGPQYNIPYQKCEDDCGCPDIDSARFFDEIDNYSSVVCVDNPELVAKVVKDGKVVRGTGSANYNFSFIDSFAIDPDKQELFKPEQLSLLLPALNLPDRFDDSLADALCVYESKFDRQECAQYLGSTLIDGVSENILATSWFSKRTTTMESQFEAKKKRLTQIVGCMSGTASETEPCDQNYTVVKATSETAEMVAQKYYQISYEEFSRLAQPEQMKILAIRETRASSPVCILIKDTTVPNSPYNIQLDLGSTKVRYICGYIPGVPATREATKTMMQSLSTQAVGQQTAKDVAASLAKPATGTSPEERLLNKVESAGINCDSFSPNYQSMGSQSPSRNDGGPLNVWWSFIIPDLNNLAPMTHIYQAYLIGPTESIAQFVGTHPQAAMKNLFSSEYSASIGKAVFLPQTLTNTPPSASSEDNYINSVGQSCDPDTSEDCSTGKIEFGGDTKQNIQAGLQGGEAVNNILAVGHKLSWPQQSLSYFTSMCWANELAQKMQTNPVLGGVPLFSLIGRKVDGALTNCPSDFIATKSPSGGGQCSGTMGKALTTASGSCKLCNLDQFNQEFKSSGIGEIPAKMQEIIESAAQENNVPASLILGLMFAEGGFQRPCYNPGENGKWTDEMVCAEEIPFCNTCNVSPAGAKGPFQIMSYWFPPSKFGSACNFTDSARAAADNSRTEKDGSPCWVKGTTNPDCASIDPQYQDVIQIGGAYKCDAYSVNVGYTQGGTTCGDWTEQDVATAARAFRGICQEKYIDRVVGVWKKYTCK